ncbi:MAG: lipase [Rheinheimera sp.]|uniref:VolA/Pla-1 family phospholipase n=1 Tax=Arsukibacterium sp. UBA3155 TaxID=1946058 RepID=UPI000C944476|nr:VolA/Pla-1 family phospholipase [Arsukibacterium sp. UBA3155]MAD75085.1 lipase [Rheinheimera sp.]|tara:strand:- start:98735 stop:101140 length:2406 start_codon:yes stop_codon:yes gene_type:complete
MKKLAISIAVAAAVGLAGCGDSLEDLKQEAAQPGGTVVPASRVIFDPTASRVSVPNDLLFQGTTDGTLTLDSGANPDYTNPQVALGALDGWSTQNPFAIDLSFPPGVTLNADTAQAPGAVRVFKALMGDPASPEAACTSVPRGAACQIVEELQFGQDFVTAGRGNSVAVIPLKPLDNATTYLLALTDVLQDSTGESIKPSTTYELVKQDITTLPLASASQRALQGVINSFENVMARDEGVNKDNIIYTAAITTQSVGAVLSTLKQLMASPTPTGYGPSALVVNNTGLTVSQLNPAFAGSPAFAITRYYTGTLTLPYYLGMPTEANPRAPLNARWMARCDSGATLAALPASMKPESPVSENDGACQAFSGGALRDLGVDPARHLTKFNTIPKINSYQAVDVQMTVPDANVITMPEAGWPVVILQHGITSRRSDMLAITGTLASQGFATVAIDHPLHGDRGFTAEVQNAEGQTSTLTFNASTNSATDYMNLSNLLVTRDNLRQSIADMLALRLALNFIQGVDLDTSRVQFLGHSLGGITGTSMVALANTSTGNAQLDALYSVETAALAMPGGAVANFLLDSAAFGPLIKASVMLGAGGELTSQFVTYVATNTNCGVPTAATAASYPACAAPVVNAYLMTLTEPANAAQQARVSATLSQFAFAAQTVTDAGDPNNYAERMVNSETPVYMIEVVGDGMDNLPDQVIPNGFFNPLAALAAGRMPLAGTEPLARLLGADAIPAAAGGWSLEGGNAIARFNAGNHSSILSPAGSPAATQEMQTQSVTFFLNRGQAVLVSNPAVLASGN